MVTINRGGAPVRKLFQLLLQMGTATNLLCGGVTSLEKHLLWEILGDQVSEGAVVLLVVRNRVVVVRLLVGHSISQGTWFSVTWLCGFLLFKHNFVIDIVDKLDLSALFVAHARARY